VTDIEIKELIESFHSVMNFFGCVDKTILWFTTPNPQLGSTVPLIMFFDGRSAKVRQFIRVAIDENQAVSEDVFERVRGC
jgi:hypothetical protein